MPLSFRVYTPPCYDREQQHLYPVLYLIHGRTYTDDQWDRLGADEAADALIAGGQIPPFIIVMPRDRSWIKPPRNRFGEALTDELVPWIDAHYRTIPNRTSRAIGGLSWGGNWAVRLGLSQWSLFASIGVHSAPTFDIDGPPRISAWLEEIPRQELPRFFMDSGKNDYHLNEIMLLESTLTDAGVPHEWHLYPGYHEESYWSAHVEEYIRWYAQEW
jgi:enterochelin esterase-like enzyme